MPAGTIFMIVLSIIAGGSVLGYVVFDFIYYLSYGKRYFEHTPRRRFVEGFFLLLPLIILIWDRGASNDCCHESALFSPEHRLSIDVVWALCLIAYLFSSYKKELAGPAIEIIASCLLLIGLVLIILFALQLQNWPGWVFIALPQSMLFIMALADNHKMAIANISDWDGEGTLLFRVCRKIVLLPVFIKLPLLLILCLPILLLLVGILFLFGQKPDSMLRAFTDTYKNGFSQIDAQCDSVVCPGGHFLCTVAARGHPHFVRPLRRGIRAGKDIKCNRQLLVANAFEELLEQKLPWLHRPIRAVYNKVGDGIHRYYGIFNNKWVADAIYLLMKPLEWMFLLVLYLADRKPENRIAQQYLDWEDRRQLNHTGNKFRAQPVVVVEKPQV